MGTTRSQAQGWRFENTYACLPEAFYERTKPAPFPLPQLLIVNHKLAQHLGLRFMDTPQDELAQLFSGQALPEGSQPIAQAYAGHQFGHLAMLGDGRALLLGEQRAPDGSLHDIQFKGSGQTRYSRRGDGRAVLGPMLREYIISEAMHALGIPTTRSLAVAVTGEWIVREVPKPGAILTRTASSHLRVGTFWFAALQQDHRLLVSLADYAIARHFPELIGRPERHLAFFRRVMERQASLIAAWQSIGFIHGVMNTDNMTISGETIDYGPCAFMDAYDPDTVFSSIDEQGRYRYAHQPAIAHWNLTRLAEALLPLFAEDEPRAIEMATRALDEFPQLYQRAYLARMRSKLGLFRDDGGDAQLIEGLLAWMHAAKADFTNTFRELDPSAPAPAHAGDGSFIAWHAAWRERLARENRSIDAVQARMRTANPAIIPRNHRVEAALGAAERRQDLAPLRELLAALANPLDPHSEYLSFAEPPPAGFGSYQTFCGT